MRVKKKPCLCGKWNAERTANEIIKDNKSCKKDILVTFTESIKEKLRIKGIKEKEILEDFERHRKARCRR